MQKLGLIGGAAATLVIAGVAMAAAPTATPGTASPAATPTPATTVTPGTTTTPTAPAPATTAPAPATTGAASPSTTWSAPVQPLVLQGTASFAEKANKSATLTLAMQGLAPDQTWSVSIFRGGMGNVPPAALLFKADRVGPDRLGRGTLTVHLTAAEYRTVRQARRQHGVSILISDGTRDAVATLAKS